jgi:glycosyltransferase involved in cell wall biosynthesis
MGAKYLFVINSFLAGGAERSLLDLLPELARRGVKPIVATLRVSEIGFEQELAVAGYQSHTLRAKGRLGQVRALRKLIRSLRPDLVYTSLFEADLVGRLACIGLGVPVMSNLANTAYDPARLADPNVDARRLKIVQVVDGITARHLTDHFHAVSQAVKDSAVATLGLAPDRITVVKRGRDAGLLGSAGPGRRAEVRAALGVAHEAEVVVSVGRQEFQKGHAHLIEAFAGVAAGRPSARLLIAGREGHSTQDLRRRIQDLGLGDVVTLLGHRGDVPDVLAAADLFVFPSLYEGLGGALIEAMALELPVVASDLPALREVVREGENAVLVPAGDAAALEHAIVDLLADPQRRRRFGLRSRQLFEEEFRLDGATRDLLDLLEQIARPKS